jgi:hypothetical protein
VPIEHGVELDDEDPALAIVDVTGGAGLETTLEGHETTAPGGEPPYEGSDEE